MLGIFIKVCCLVQHNVVVVKFITTIVFVTLSFLRTTLSNEGRTLLYDN